MIKILSENNTGKFTHMRTSKSSTAISTILLVAKLAYGSAQAFNIFYSSAVQF